MWFMETPWPPIILLGIAEFILLLLWMGNARNLYTVLLVLLPVLAIVIFGIEKLIVTAREEVETNLIGVVQAFEREDLDGTIDYFSVPLQSDMKLRVEPAMELVTVNGSIRITDVNIDLLANNSRATSHFRANGQFQVTEMGTYNQPTRWELTWQREAGEWKIIRVNQLHVISGEVVREWLD